MSKTMAYVIHKDSLYLHGYQKSDIREFDRNGKLSDVYTGIWATGMNGAKVYKHKLAAQEMARQLDADGVDSVFAEVRDDADEGRA